LTAPSYTNIQAGAQDLVVKNITLDQGVQVGANDVTFENVDVTPSLFYTDGGGDWYYGFLIGDVTGVVIKDSTINGVEADDATAISDITASAATEFTVDSVAISNVWNGILIDSAGTQANLVDNSISNAKHGIYVTQADATDQTITGNSIFNPQNLSDGSDGDAISVPTGTAGSVVTQLQNDNHFTGVAAGKDVFVR